MRIRNRNRLRSIVVIVGLVLLAGCSTLPTAPIVQSPAGDGTTADVTNTAEPALLGGLIGSVGGTVGGVVGGVVGAVGGVLPPVLAPIGAVADTLIRSLAIVDGSGGTVSNGKVTIVVPPGAVRGNAEVKVVVASNTALSCHLEINPPEANGFEVPVTLRINASGQPHVERLGIAWFNPQTREWEPIDSRADVATGIVEAELPHFSEYRVQEVLKSKAGW